MRCMSRVLTAVRLGLAAPLTLFGCHPSPRLTRVKHPAKALTGCAGARYSS